MVVLSLVQHLASGAILIFGDNPSTGNIILIQNWALLYNHPRYAEGSNEVQCFLAGSHEFQLSEIEVYLKE
jgi:hypothetical protein